MFILVNSRSYSYNSTKIGKWHIKNSSDKSMISTEISDMSDTFNGQLDQPYPLNLLSNVNELIADVAFDLGFNHRTLI